MDDLLATYRLAVDPARAGARAASLAVEQTAELPDGALAEFPEAIVGRVEAVEPDGPGHARATIAYPRAAIADDPAQLLNVLLGNAALQDDVRLVDVRIPDALARALGGPAFGIEGLRRAAGAAERPMTVVALKPMASPERLAAACGAFARAGVDWIKDDHGLADRPGCRLADRLAACGAAIEEAAAATGRRAAYVPNLVGPPDALARGLDAAAEAGAGAALVAPALVGLPAFHALARARAARLFAHPSLAGTARIALPALLGTLFRALGADAVLFPHAGGRFAVGEAECAELAARLREPAAIRAALPVPAGGASPDRVAALLGFYGRECALLAGGTLYSKGSEPVGLETEARAFVDAVRP